MRGGKPRPNSSTRMPAHLAVIKCPNSCTSTHMPKTGIAASKNQLFMQFSFYMLLWNLWMSSVIESSLYCSLKFHGAISAVILSAAKNPCLASEILRCAQNDSHAAQQNLTKYYSLYYSVFYPEKVKRSPGLHTVRARFYAPRWWFPV